MLHLDDETGACAINITLENGKHSGWDHRAPGTKLSLLIMAAVYSLMIAGLTVTGRS